MNLVRKHPAFRYEAGAFHAFNDNVVNEARIEIDINDGQGRLAMLALPQELDALAVGFLIAEGVLGRIEDLHDVQVQPKRQRVCLHGDLNSEALETLNRRWTWGTGCGGGGMARDVDAPACRSVAPGPLVQSQALLELMRQFQQQLTLWQQTGAVHACALSDGQRALLAAQDVGRHNAFDKVVGWAAFDRIDLANKLMITTGRLSAEIVSKAIACGLPLPVSRCAVTGLSVDLARRFGATLVGFARGGRLNVYTGYERIAHT